MSRNETLLCLAGDRFAREVTGKHLGRQSSALSGFQNLEVLLILSEKPVKNIPRRMN